jgi:DNA end-binding protein Ku
VKVFPATDASATISFNQLHGECQTRIQQKKWCSKCAREVANTEIVKGYEFEKGHYVVMNEDDLAKVKSESTRIIDLVQFTDASAIDPIYIDKAYYLAPEGTVAAQSFAVMRDGMAGKAGVGKLALYGREYFVAVRPQGHGFVMYTMHQAAEIRSMEAIDELRDLPTSIKPAEAKLAKQVIDSFEGPLNLADFKDEYQLELRRIIDAKIAGQEVVAPPADVSPKVVDLMEALRKSLDAVSQGKKKPAKADLPKKGAIAKVEKMPAPKKRAAGGRG